ncbi:MAG: malate synthase A [Bdellovibrionia bacterium]
MEIQGKSHPVLTPEALAFVEELHRKFNPRRQELLAKRAERQAQIDAGRMPQFLEETRPVRESEWKVASCPADLMDRRVEITGPAEPKMVINALNSGAKVFMADFEDSLSPTWENVTHGQQCMRDAVRKTLRFESPEGKTYALKDQLATLVVRPRGWHLDEKHALVDGKPVSASLFDFGMYFFHNAKELISRGTGPYFYLPKMESHLEARLWNDVFNHAQDKLGIPRGTIRATVLIETILASFEMDEILYELRDHASGLNAGRWDYIFSMIKKFRNRPDMILPDRAQVTMTVPFMRAYTDLLVKTCHRRGAHAMGGMSAFIPSRRDADVNRVALAKVREDKERESGDGFDGTWVAHPDLVPIAMESFDRVLGSKPNQKDKQKPDVNVKAEELIRTTIPGSSVSEAGIRANVDVALQYIERWLSGTGAAAIHNLMEDAATAEISRAQIWQWIRHRVRLADGREMSADLYRKILGEELQKLGGVKQGRYGQATEILDSLILSPTFSEFLTVPAYKYLD